MGKTRILWKNNEIFTILSGNPAESPGAAALRTPTRFLWLEFDNLSEIYLKIKFREKSFLKSHQILVKFHQSFNEK